jgi:hypothetical protein
MPTILTSGAKFTVDNYCGRDLIGPEHFGIVFYSNHRRQPQEKPPRRDKRLLVARQ